MAPKSGDSCSISETRLLFFQNLELERHKTGIGNRHMQKLYYAEQRNLSLISQNLTTISSY